MNISMYQASAPRFVNMLNNLSAILDKAQAHAEAKKIDPPVLNYARLFPDMLPMTRQVQIACDAAKGAVARLAGVEIPKHDDTEKTFAELKARIAKTIDFITSVKPAQIDGSRGQGDRAQVRGDEVKFKGCIPARLRLPNFYFHVTTAYEILRHNGVESASAITSVALRQPVTNREYLRPGRGSKQDTHPEGGKP